MIGQEKGLRGENVTSHVLSERDLTNHRGSLGLEQKFLEADKLFSTESYLVTTSGHDGLGELSNSNFLKLQELLGEDIGTYLTQLIRDPQRNDGMRESAMGALVKLGHSKEETFRALGEILRTEPTEEYDNVRLQSMAAWSLSEFGLPALPEIIKSSNSPYSLVRKEAIQVLRHYGQFADEILPTVIQGLHDKDEKVRLSALFCFNLDGGLQKNGLPALPVLIEKFDDPSDDVREFAVVAVKVVCKDSVGLLREYYNPGASLLVRESLLECLNNNSVPCSRDGLDLVMEGLKDNNIRVFNLAFDLLPKYGEFSPEIISKLTAAIGTSDPYNVNRLRRALQIVQGLK